VFKLLIVDDERNTREGLIECIKWQELEIGKIEQAEDGLLALEKASVFKPDIILCDIRMPKMNGLDFSARVRDLLPDCKIIFLSGYSDKEYLKTAIRLQAVDYIEKPVNLDEVQKAVSKAVSLYKQNEIKPGDNEEPQTFKTENKNVTDIIRFIHQNLSDSNLSLQFISDFSLLAPTYICSIFKCETNKTINQYITEVRIERAKQLLFDKKLNIKMIANMTGYNDPKYFAKLFKKYVGVTPSKFRGGV